jgi:O-antigen ligase
MPEHIRALFVILVLSTAVFYFASRFTLTFTSEENFTRRRNLWFGITLAAFITQNYWIYFFIAVPLIIYANRRETNPSALFFFILFALPVARVQIPGMGLINYFFELTHPRELALLILLPAFLNLRRQSDTPAFGRTGPDKFFAAYLLLTAILLLRDFKPTENMRQMFYIFIDTFLPYYVISRSLKSLPHFRDALLSMVLAIMVLALLASFEFIKHWLLYPTVSNLPGMSGGMTGYLSRDVFLRAIVTSGQSIVLGYLMVIGIGLYLFLQKSIQHNLARKLGMLLLISGSFSAMARGPWIGAAVLFVIFFLTGRHAVRSLMGLALAAAIIFPLISILPGGEKVINLLPFIGTTDKENVDYRERLMENSIIVIQRNPWFGSIDYKNTPEMESMRQGEGIIDIVNSFIQVTLDSGFVGLGLYVAFFMATLLGIYRAMHSIPDRDSEEYLLGRVLLATILSIMFIIISVSSITYIPIVYWSVAGMGVAYAQMIRKNTHERLR